MSNGKTIYLNGLWIERTERGLKVQMQVNERGDDFATAHIDLKGMADLVSFLKPKQEKVDGQLSFSFDAAK